MVEGHSDRVIRAQQERSIDRGDGPVQGLPLSPAQDGAEHGLEGAELLFEHLFFFQEHVFFRLRHDDFLLHRLARPVTGQREVLDPDEQVPSLFQQIGILVGGKEIVIDLLDPGRRLQFQKFVHGF